NPPLINNTIPFKPDAVWQTRQIGVQQCCWMHTWHPTDPDRLLVIDGADNQRAAVYQWSASQGTMQFLTQDAPPTHQSPDGTYTITLNGNQANIHHVADSKEYHVDTGGAMPSLSTDNSRLLWINSPLAIPGGNRPQATIYVSDIDGSNPYQVIAAPGASAQWLDASRLLVRLPGDGQQSALHVYDTTTGENYGLVSATYLRGVDVAPGGGRIMYYLTFQDDPAASGIYTIETKPDAQPQKIAWFGGWRWRDANSVYYIPLDASAPYQTLHYYDVITGEDVTLTTPETVPFVIMNGDWGVSADGQRIVFQNGIDAEMTLLETIE
ncbi:MAG TPA: hypothetical protein VHL11_19755, partial [Phototrophicaceae bacterium]|nr:hypothetical protein [Phototrophicaceae bacterium]